MKLTPQELEFYSALEHTFNTPGWTLIRQGWEEERDRLAGASFSNAKSFEDVQLARVRYGLLHELITLPETTEQGKATMLDAPDDTE